MTRKPDDRWWLRRALRIGRDVVVERAPELAPLRDKVVAVFGVGCIGAPTALEFARAGVQELRIMDHDAADAAALLRWPFGLPTIGEPKVGVLDRFISEHYPRTRVVARHHKIGVPRSLEQRGPPEWEIVRAFLHGASLVYDATTEWGIHHYLSHLTRRAGIPYVMIAGRQGGWGGEIMRDVPDGVSGCWGCYCHHLRDGTIKPPPFDERGITQPASCADPTFTGANFDLAPIATAGVRLAVATLCRGAAGGYPDFDWDVAVVALREKDGRPIAPRFQTHRLTRHPACRNCR